MKIAIVGCGALGSYYGACLCRAGHVVHGLLRSDYAAVQNDGWRILSPDGGFQARPLCARFPGEIGPSDVVLIGLKTTANAEFARLLPPLIGPDTLLVTLQNGLGNEEQLTTLFGPENILGGLCFVCLNRLAPGVIHHTAHGRIVLGEYGRPTQPRTRNLCALFNEARVPCDLTENLMQAHWEKLVWNVPFNGLGVAGVAGFQAMQNGTISSDTLLGPVLTTDQLLSNPRWERLTRDLMREVIATARVLDFDLVEDLVAINIDRTRCMGAYKASTLLDYERGLPLELEALFQQPLQAARQQQVATPILAHLCDVLTELDLYRKYQLTPQQLKRMK